MFDSLEFIYGPVLNLLSGFANWVNELGQDYWGLFMILGVYQLVAIKWQLINRNRHQRVPNSFVSGQKRIISSAAQPFRPQTMPAIDNPPPAAPRANILREMAPENSTKDFPNLKFGESFTEEYHFIHRKPLNESLMEEYPFISRQQLNESFMEE